MVFANSLVVFPVDSDAFFATVQSRVHEIWARFFGSSLKEDLRYTPSDCFETFPFFEGSDNGLIVARAGDVYATYRAQLLIANNQGLTATYNRFNDPDELDPGIVRLRNLHDALDRAVLDAYGWSDLKPSSEFLLDHDEVEDLTRRRRKSWRYRWPDDLRDEVLARLLELNRLRAQRDPQFQK